MGKIMKSIQLIVVMVLFSLAAKTAMAQSQPSSIRVEIPDTYATNALFLNLFKLHSNFVFVPHSSVSSTNQPSFTMTIPHDNFSDYTAVIIQKSGSGDIVCSVRSEDNATQYARYENIAIQANDCNISH